MAGMSNHPGWRSETDHAGEENAHGGSLRPFTAPFLRSCCKHLLRMLSADDGTTDTVSFADALSELIFNSKRDNRHRKAAEEGAIPNVRCFD